MSNEQLFWIGPGMLQLKEPLAPGSAIPPGSLGDAEAAGLIEKGMVSLTAPGEAEENVTSTATPPKPVDPLKIVPLKWDVDPITLVGKTLDELNNMIADLAERMSHPAPPVFDTIEEAASFLGQDRE